MPTFQHGKSTVFKIDDSGATVRDISTAVSSVSFPREVDATETTSFGSSQRTYIVGLANSTVSVEGYFDSTFDGYLAGIVGGAAGTIEYGPMGSTAGNIKYTAEGILTSYELSSGVGDAVTFSAEFQITGAVTRGTYS
jgi:hypothetical protein